MDPARSSHARETFASRFGLLMTMLGVAIGLGNVWRLPYMVGKFGGAAFVLVYILAVVAVGVPGLMAEWALGRHTGRGTLGAFQRAGLPGGRMVGVLLFAGMAIATGYYTNVVGWVLYSGVAEIAGLVGGAWNTQAILPPQSGFEIGSLLRQLLCTALLLLASALVLTAGLRSGIERVSKRIMPVFLLILLLVLWRTLTLPGAFDGVRWYILRFEPAQLTGSVVVAAIGQAAFSIGLGGTFMVVYGSYMGRDVRLGQCAWWTAGGDLAAGLLAGLAVVPAVIALGLEPAGGPGLLFSTLPQVFDRMPLGGVVGALFYAGLLGAAFLSVVGALEVTVAGLTDATRLSRAGAVWIMVGVVYLLSLAPMVNMQVFTPWDLTFGSGMQTLGALLSVLTVGWALQRAHALRGLAGGGAGLQIRALVHWLRFGVPAIILLVGIWWLLTDVLGVFASV